MTALDLGLLAVRLVLGLAIASHGAQKLFGWFGGYGLKGTGGFFESLGFRPGTAFAALAGLAELGGGLLFVLGFVQPLGLLLIASVMVVAAMTVHLPKGFFASNGGYELPVINVAAAAAIAFAGPGAYSLDAVAGTQWLSAPAYVWLALGLGFAGGLANLALRRAPAQPQTSS